MRYLTLSADYLPPSVTDLSAELAAAVAIQQQPAELRYDSEGLSPTSTRAGAWEQRQTERAHRPGAARDPSGQAARPGSAVDAEALVLFGAGGPEA